MILTAEDLAAIDTLLERRLAGRTAAPQFSSPEVIVFQLTVRQFACAIDRCEKFVTREIGARKLAAPGGRPYHIHPRELLKYGVDSQLAMARLRQAKLLGDGRSTAAQSSQPHAA